MYIENGLGCHSFCVIMQKTQKNVKNYEQKFRKSPQKSKKKNFRKYL